MYPLLEAACFKQVTLMVVGGRITHERDADVSRGRGFHVPDFGLASSVPWIYWGAGLLPVQVIYQ